MITTSTAWDSLCTRPGEAVHLVRLYYGDETNYLALSTRDLTLGGVNYLGVLRSVPPVVSQIDINSHEHSIQSFSLDVKNLEFQPGKRVSDFIETLGSTNDYGFYNRKVEVKLYLDGITSWSDCFPVFTGICRNIKQSRTALRFDIEDNSEKVYINIGTDKITSSDAPTGGAVPSASLGKTKPIIYGDHGFHYGQQGTLTNITHLTANNMTKAVYLGMTTAGKHRYLVSNHTLNAYNTAGYYVWMYDNKLRRMVKVDTTAVTWSTSGSDVIIEIDNLPSLYDYWYPNTDFTESNQYDGDFSNDAYACDLDWSTVAISSLDSTVHAVNSRSGVLVKFNAYDGYQDDTNIQNVNVWGKVDYSESGTLPDYDFYIDAVGNDLSGFSSSSLNQLLNHTGINATKTEVGASHTISHRLNDVSNANTSTAKIYMLFKEIEYTPTEMFDVYVACKGYEYGTWINSRTGHADNGSSGSLIENPAGIIESILRDHMGIASADIDTSSFNTASTDVSSYPFAFAITDEMNTGQLLAALARECRSFVYPQSDNTFKMFVIQDTYASSDRTLSHDDISGHDFDRTPPADIRTNVKVGYFRSNQSGQNQYYTSLLQYGNNDTYYNLSGNQGQLIFESEFLRDATGAQNLRNYLCRFKKLVHNLSSGKVGKEHLLLDIGDVIEFADMPYKVSGEDIESSNTRVSQTVYPYWLIIGTDRGTKMKFNVIQLHNLS